MLFLYFSNIYEPNRYLKNSPWFHPWVTLILASPIWVISKNLIALHLCASRISKNRIAVFKIYPGFALESPSGFGITNFCDIKECNYTTFMWFSCAFRISKSRIAIYKIYPGCTTELLSDFKVNTFIAIISINIPIELAFDVTLIESKGLFGEIKKWENCNFFLITLFRLIFNKNLQGNYKNLQIMIFDFKFLIILW